MINHVLDHAHQAAAALGDAAHRVVVSVHLAIKNPLDGIVPDFTVFGVEFTKFWQKLFAGVWGVLIIYSIYKLTVSIAQVRADRKGGYTEDLQEHTKGVKYALGGLIALLGLPVIVGTAFALAGS